MSDNSTVIKQVPAHPVEVSEQVDRIELQIMMLVDATRARRRQQAAELDPALQPTGFRTLLALVMSGPAGAGALADRLGYDKSVLSRQLHQLELLGLVSRDSDPADRRGIVVSATPEAVARVHAMQNDARDAFRRDLSEWSAQDLRDLSRLLGRLALTGKTSP
jgi:DNA-binding MarR family transcriptional regulator